MYRRKPTPTVTVLTGARDEPWPIDSVYISFSSANPAAKFGGTWAAIGTGRMLIGIDPADANMDVAGDTGGTKTNTLTGVQLPPHDHSIAHTHAPPGGVDNWLVNTPGAAANRANGTGFHAKGVVDSGGASNSNSGNGPGTNQPINNLPPYLAVYMWRRTA